MFETGGPSFVELARQALSSTDRGYDLLAPKFDHTPFRTPVAITEGLRPVFDEQPVKRAIDLCTGTGAGAEALLWVATERVVGIDRSLGMLDQARTQVAHLGARGASATFHQRDATSPPAVAATFSMSASKGAQEAEATEGQRAQTQDLAAGSFDLATCFGAFGHLEAKDEGRFVASVRSYLCDGGRFVFVTADPPPAMSRAHLSARVFNGAMHVRNALIKPRFVMFYLTFLLPRAQSLLEANGFDVEVRRQGFAKFPSLVTVVATKRGTR